MRRRSSWKRKLAFVALTGVGLALIGAMALVWLALYTPPPLPPVTPQQFEEAREQLAHTHDILASVAEAAARGRREPFRIEVAEEHVTTFATSDAEVRSKLTSRGVRDARVRFHDGQVIASGFIAHRGRDLYVTARGTPVMGASGHMEMEGLKVRVGRLDAPAAIAEKARQAINELLRSEDFDIPADIRAIDARDGILVLEGTSRPYARTR